MNRQNQQFRRDMNGQFGGMANIMIGIAANFAGLFAANFVFVIWDKRAMTRPFGSKVKEMEKNLRE